MTNSEDWEDPEAEYADETEVCHHGIPLSAECEWCDEEEGCY